MDLVLNVCDEFVLDRVWSRLVPLSAFADVTPGFVSVSSVAINASTKPLPGSSWSHLVSSLPHPPLQTLNGSHLPYADIGSVSAWPRDYFLRQVLSLSVITLIGIHLLYFVFAGLSYAFIFNHEMMKHPRFLKNQVRLEILSSLKAFPGMTLLTLPWFQGEVMGYSKLYDDVGKYGWGYLFFSVVL